ncbi:protein fem-1 homolog B isoform X2 [Calliopsis andreniformis]|uniref:protein fem-1 homolog B isoform X2 n=1 Tax=Calliopsis andreniformis TaxID=337506 RepID=UPI003FCCADAA
MQTRLYALKITLQLCLKRVMENSRALNKEKVVTSNEDRVEMPELLVTRVYYAAKDGMAIALYDLLRDQSPEQINRVINQKVLEEDGHYCTPLIIAARYGHDKVVKILLDKFKPNLEEEGIVKFDGHVIKRASALWCAASAGHLTVVKTLVKAGANVNHYNENHSTPLRTACFDGRLDIVRYLIGHNADLNIPNCFNTTCLMLASYKGHLDIVKFLLEKGANPNENSNCYNCTALHLAAEYGPTSIVSELLKYGSKMTKDVNGMTPLLLAAERARAEVVECFLQSLDISRKEKIDVYELLGASYVNNAYKGYYYVPVAYGYLLKAMELRYKDPNNIIYKELGRTVKAYDHWKECETIESLKSIEYNLNAIYMESLAIRERILGKHNPGVFNHIIFRGANFANNGRFDRCMELWLYALHLKQLNNLSVAKDLLRCAQVFSYMILVGTSFECSQILSVLEASIKEFGHNKSKISNPDSEEDFEQHTEEMELSITSTLYILSILTKLLKSHGNKYTDHEKSKAYHLVHKICGLQLRLNDGQTLLHLAVNAETSIDADHINDTCKFPCVATTKLLIRCGADVNAMDYKNNTPLHTIISCRNLISDFAILQSIVMELTEAGAHMDTVNSSGLTPYDIAITGEVKTILKTQTKLSLKCMAAKAVKTYNLAYHGKVPRFLESFIELHGFGFKND